MASNEKLDAKQALTPAKSEGSGKSKPCSRQEIHARGEFAANKLLESFVNDVEKPSKHALLKAEASLLAMILRPIDDKIKKQNKQAKKKRSTSCVSADFGKQEKILNRMEKRKEKLYEEATSLALTFAEQMNQPDVITTDKYIRNCRRWARNSYLAKYLPFNEHARKPAKAKRNETPTEALATESNSVTVCQDQVLITKNEKFSFLSLPLHVANNFTYQNKSSEQFKETLKSLQNLPKVLGVGVLDGNRVGVVYKPKEEVEDVHMSIYKSADGQREVDELLIPPKKWKSNYGCSIWSTAIKKSKTSLAIVGYYKTNQLGVREIGEEKSKFSNIDVDKADDVQLLRFNYSHEINKGVFVAKCTNRARLIKIIDVSATGEKPRLKYRVQGREVAPASRDDWRPWSSCITSPGLVFIKDGTRNVVDLFHTGGQHVMCLDNRSSLLILKHGELISDMTARCIGNQVHLFFHSNTSATFQMNEIQRERRVLKLSNEDEDTKKSGKAASLDGRLKLLLAKDQLKFSDHVWSVVQVGDALAVCDSAEKQVIVCKMQSDGTVQAENCKVAFKWSAWISGMCKADENRLLLATHDSLLLINLQKPDRQAEPLQYSRYSNYNRAYLFVSSPKENRKPYVLIENLYTSTLRQCKDVRFDNDVISFSETCLWTMSNKKPGVMAYGKDCDLIALSFIEEKSEIYKVAVLEDSEGLGLRQLGTLQKPEKAEWRFVNMTFGGEYCFINCSLTGLIAVYNAKLYNLIAIFSDKCMGLALTTLRNSAPQPEDAPVSDGKEKRELSTLQKGLLEVVVLGSRRPQEGVSRGELTGIFKFSLDRNSIKT